MKTNDNKRNTVRLYVESYDVNAKELWLDFADLDEFYFFYQASREVRERFYNIPDEYIENSEEYFEIRRFISQYVLEARPDGQRYIDEGRYIPSMILVEDFSSEKDIKSGYCLEIPTVELLAVCCLHRYFEEDYEIPATVMWVTTNESFAFILNATETKIVKYCVFDLDKRIEKKLNTEWEGPPCALRNCDNNFDVHVWDVGQGNTNSVSDGRDLTLFDFGCSKLYSTDQQLRILKDHDLFIKNHERISLIISHWDIDHYNLLCNVGKEFIEGLCCVFVVKQTMTATASQVLNRLATYCKFVRQMTPFPKTSGRNSHVQLRIIFDNRNYTLFLGENSSDKNKSGFALSMYGDRKAVLLTADHSDIQVWSDMYNELSRRSNGMQLSVVVPHHGGYCGDLIIPASCKPKTAVVSVGKNYYKHPRQDVLDQYSHAGFKILRTDWERKDIIIKVD